MINSLWKRLRAFLAVAVVLAIPAYAICAMTTSGAAGTVNVTLADSDDPIGNGLHIVNQSVRTQPNVEANFDFIPRAVFLIDWVFTNKGQPSPYG
jgi:hypothetical protein